MASLQVKRVRVSVGIPSSYYDKIMLQDFMRENPGKTADDAPKPTVAQLQEKRAETQTRIQAAVTPLLPSIPSGEDPYPLVQVWDYPDLPDPVTPKPSTASQAMNWLAESWQTLAIIGLAMVAMLIARSALNGGDTAPTPAFSEGFGLNIPVPSQEEIADAGNGEQSDGMQITGGSLKEELVRLVEGNPDVAANVLRAWITDAA